MFLFCIISYILSNIEQNKLAKFTLFQEIIQIEFKIVNNHNYPNNTCIPWDTVF